MVKKPLLALFVSFEKVKIHQPFAHFIGNLAPGDFRLGPIAGEKLRMEFSEIKILLIFLQKK